MSGSSGLIAGTYPRLRATEEDFNRVCLCHREAVSHRLLVNSLKLFKGSFYREGFSLLLRKAES